MMENRMIENIEDITCCGRCLYFDYYNEQQDDHPGRGYCTYYPENLTMAAADDKERASDCIHYFSKEEYRNYIRNYKEFKNTEASD